MVRVSAPNVKATIKGTVGDSLHVPYGGDSRPQIFSLWEFNEMICKRLHLLTELSIVRTES